MQLSPSKVARRFPSLSLPHEGRGDDTLEGSEPMSC
jgi:hypothetical protein